ncbi:MAG: hypothetical protein Q4C86_11160 [bacterium]|nr:hypothetical protein [bacterium]
MTSPFVRSKRLMALMREYKKKFGVGYPYGLIDKSNIEAQEDIKQRLKSGEVYPYEEYKDALREYIHMLDT